uniref:Fibronectin type-III domain-containing protein n=1 Tax=Pseudonaja textilis TaxID=8673 RepID=A0A670YM13_PSETE
ELKSISLKFVILVQVNPGETFTIRTEDGHIQCIQGPAHVPMMSPNGSVPPIFVPPGYVSQVVEENGVRKVIVMPHSTEFHPSMHPPPPHVPHYIHPHPALLPHPPHPVYPPVPGTGEIPPQFIHQHPPPPSPHLYQDQGKTFAGKGGGGSNLIASSPALRLLFFIAISMSVLTSCRVSALGHSTKESVSELVSFTTESCEPDPPAAPKVVNKTKNSLTLQWKSSNDNGSKITSYLLEWDEGKTGAFKECYYGHLKQHKVTKLSPSTKYSFRLAAKNDIGMSGFGETLVCFTIGVVPPPPLPPQLSKAGVNGLSLKWAPPSGISSDDSLTYILEMEEDVKNHIHVFNLSLFSFAMGQLFAHNTEGKSGPSEVVEYSTCPDKPGPPGKPTVKGKIHSHNVKVTWGSKWETAYKGSTREHICTHLKPGVCYRLKVSCVGRGGQSQPSDILTVQTSAVPPGPCHPPCLSGKAKPKEITLQWDPPSVNGGSEISEYLLEVANSDQEEHRQAYRGQALECTVNGLLPGRTYCFWIRAANKAGLGPYSEKAEISTAPGPPDPCSTPLLTCKTATCVVATWESPPCNGAEVNEYRLEWGQMEGSMHIVYTGPLLCYEVKGLSPATTYYCRVQAVNLAGPGLFGEISTVTTPASVPAAVAVLNLLEEDQLEGPLPLSTCLALHWEEPCCHGAEIIGYHIEYGEKQVLTVNKATSHVLENLQPDTFYRIRIQAFNSLGTGPFSPSIKAKTKPLPPDPPHLECVVFSYQSLKLKWGEGPSRALIANPTQFNLQMEDRLGRFITVYSGPCHTYKVQRLSESTTYYFKIQACNDAGEGEFSEVYAFATTKSPPPAMKAPKVHQLGDNVCEVTWEPLQPMKGDAIVYILQLATGREADQIYKGPETSYRVSNVQTNCEYRFRVCAGRQYQDSTGWQELFGPYSPSAAFSSQKQELLPPSSDPAPELLKSKRKALSDEQFAFLLLVIFATVAILFAVIIQYFVIK